MAESGDAVPVPQGVLCELGCRPRTRESIFTSLALRLGLSRFDSSRWSYNLQPFASALPPSSPLPSPPHPPFLTFHTYSPRKIVPARSRMLDPASLLNSVPVLSVCPSVCSTPSPLPPLETSSLASLNSTCKLLVRPVYARHTVSTELSFSATLSFFFLSLPFCLSPWMIRVALNRICEPLTRVWVPR